MMRDKSQSAPIIITSIKPKPSSRLDVAIRCEDLQVAPGQCSAIVGPNGCGKTTLIEALLGIRLDYTVSAQILGCTSTNLSVSTKKRIGVSTQVHSFSDGVRVLDILTLHANAYGQAINTDLVEKLFLAEIFSQKYAKISGGQKKRISIYFALAHDPEIAILDEPEAGLDLQGVESVLDLIQMRTNQDATTLLVTHSATVLRHCDKLIFLRNGRVHFAGGKDEFLSDRIGDVAIEIYNDIGLPQLQAFSDRNGLRLHKNTSSPAQSTIFGTEQHVEELRKIFGAKLENGIIVRPVRDNDLFTWMNSGDHNASNRQV